jgi:hypothetical protein
MTGNVKCLLDLCLVGPIGHVSDVGHNVELSCRLDHVEDIWSIMASVLCHRHPPVLHLTTLGHLDKEETRLVSSDLHARI